MKKIEKLEGQKKAAIMVEDFDLAKLLKAQIDQLKALPAEQVCFLLYLKIMVTPRA